MGAIREARATSVALHVTPSLFQVKLNTDQYPGIASEFKVRSIPTAILFKNGSIVETVVGAVPKDSLVQMIRRHL